MTDFSPGERVPDLVVADVLEQITDGFVVLDAEGRFSYVNRSAEETLRRDRADLLGRSVEQLFPEVMRTRAFARYRRAIARQAPVRFEQTFPRLGRCFEVRLNPSAAGVAVYFRDVTEQKAVEAERRQLLRFEQDARQRAEREVRLREEVVRILSHDLRNPINAIRLNAEFALEPPGSSEAARREALTRILQSTSRMERLLHGLLDASRLEAGQTLPIEPGPVDAAAVIREGCALFEPQIHQRRIELSLSVEAGCPPVRADEDRLLQVLWNLVGNAVKFTPEGGSVGVGAQRSGATVRFFVRDSGPGVSAEDQLRLFDPYWQEKRTARLGTGLGLPTTKAIIEAHDGQLWVESELGRGTTFWFQLPADAG